MKSTKGLRELLGALAVTYFGDDVDSKEEALFCLLVEAADAYTEELAQATMAGHSDAALLDTMLVGLQENLEHRAEQRRAGDSRVD